MLSLGANYLCSILFNSKELYLENFLVQFILIPRGDPITGGSHALRTTQIAEQLGSVCIEPYGLAVLDTFLSIAQGGGSRLE